MSLRLCSFHGSLVCFWPFHFFSLFVPRPLLFVNGCSNCLQSVVRLAKPEGMSALVCVKGVGGGAVSAFDEVASEAALRLRECGALGVARVAALGVSLLAGERPTAQEQRALDDERRALRHALALGADSAEHVVVARCAAHAPDFGPLSVAAAIAARAKAAKPRLLLLGVQSSDRCDGCVPQMTAQMLGWLQCGPATALVPAGASSLRATVEGPQGNAERVVPLPAVVACHVRLNTPRIAKLQNVLRARRLPIAEHVVGADELFPQRPAVRARVVAAQDAPRRSRKQHMCRSAQELVDALKRDGILP